MWRVRFNSDSNDYVPAFKVGTASTRLQTIPPLNGMPFSRNIGIAAYTCIVLSQD